MFYINYFILITYTFICLIDIILILIRFITKIIKNHRGEIMEDKKAKFLVYIVIAFIAFIASSAVFSMTGGLRIKTTTAI